jgi:hypothetical protein
MEANMYKVDKLQINVYHNGEYFETIDLCINSTDVTDSEKLQKEIKEAFKTQYGVEYEN